MFTFCQQLYASLLALVSVKAGHRWSSIVIRHLNSILLVAFCVYVYRDVFPLATYTKHSQDQSEGWVLWAKVSILAIVALYIPLTIPRRYIPFDPEVYNDTQCLPEADSATDIETDRTLLEFRTRSRQHLYFQ